MVKQLGIMMVSVLAVVAASADIAFEVKDVEAHQRYPWNGKVDIDFTIDSAVEGSNFTVSVSAEDTVGKTNVVLSAVRYDDKVPLSRLGKIAAGRHRLTWDGDADVPDTLIPSLAFSVSAWAGETVFPDPELYMVVELSGGMSAGQYPVSYLPSVPKGGWTDEYKTTKLVLRKIPGKQFYAGVFEVTQKQWELVMGGKPYVVKNTHTTSWPSSTCNTLGGIYPVSVPVPDVYEFMSRLPGQFRLPTWDEWFFVCDANTQRSHQRMLNMGVVGWTRENSEEKLHPVGMKCPNAWGIYDMYGNVREQVTRVGKYISIEIHAVGGSCYSRAANCGVCFGSANSDNPSTDSVTTSTPCSLTDSTNFGVEGSACGRRCLNNTWEGYDGIGFRVFYDLP